MRRLIYLSIQIIHSFQRHAIIIKVLYTFKGGREKRVPVRAEHREIRQTFSPPLFLSLFLCLLTVQARWSNSKNLEDDPIRRWDQRGRYDERRKVISHLRSWEWNEERAFFFLLHSGMSNGIIQSQLPQFIGWLKSSDFIRAKSYRRAACSAPRAELFLHVRVCTYSASVTQRTWLFPSLRRAVICISTGFVM